MIITRLNGGLGNQMFQYAAGRSLAFIRDTELKLDISPFNHDTLRDYELAVYRIRDTIASGADLERVRHPLPGAMLHPVRALGAALRKDAIRYVREKHFHVDPAFFSLPDNVYLEGYWQSEEYFRPVGALIREEFRLRAGPGPVVQDLARQIGEGDAISIHVRRGDFVSNPTTNATHGTCPASYYQRAVEKIAGLVEDARFWIFSDDPAWVTGNLRLDHPARFVSDHHLKGYEDMYLMSCCRHHIIANSSFSWWGAYLGSHPAKIVIAPERWFSRTDLDTRDLIPPAWIRL